MMVIEPEVLARVLASEACRLAQIVDNAGPAAPAGLTTASGARARTAAASSLRVDPVMGGRSFGWAVT
ncbi:hypothetical protein EFL95_14080 [Nocardioides marmorisolisilvae]|uniref:Uncharacterized protein n=1 Tax=Nocardioides marmorisolisilvae TaxID=1542737 RepID=A0A3N0DWP9_9ACTN|nr:hypothetical protein EFL95_14080 [Nocardioides marmorisolisilvae]